MTRIALIFAVIVAVAFANGRAFADDLRIVSSDTDATLVPLMLGKSIVIDTPAEISKAIISDPSIVNAVVESTRRVFLYASKAGQANIFFYDAKGQGIGALDVWVTDSPIANAAWRKDTILYFGGGYGFRTLDCTPTVCMTAREQPPPPAPSPFTIVVNNQPAK
jgi:hypothetical protein